MQNNWENRPADIPFLIDSGLLFEINRQLTHPFGIAIVARKDEQGKMVLDVKDYRNAPEEALFKKETRDACRAKYKKFMKEFGNSQLDKRVSKLGHATQWVSPDIGA